jgi:hypothetical protein
MPKTKVTFMKDDPFADPLTPDFSALGAVTVTGPQTLEVEAPLALVESFLRSNPGTNEDINDHSIILTPIPN